MACANSVRVQHNTTTQLYLYTRRAGEFRVRAGTDGKRGIDAGARSAVIWLKGREVPGEAGNTRIGPGAETSITADSQLGPARAGVPSSRADPDPFAGMEPFRCSRSALGWARASTAVCDGWPPLAGACDPVAAMLHGDVREHRQKIRYLIGK